MHLILPRGVTKETRSWFLGGGEKKQRFLMSNKSYTCPSSLMCWELLFVIEKCLIVSAAVALWSQSCPRGAPALTHSSCWQRKQENPSGLVPSWKTCHVLQFALYFSLPRLYRVGFSRGWRGFLLQQEKTHQNQCCRRVKPEMFKAKQHWLLCGKFCRTAQVFPTDQDNPRPACQWKPVIYCIRNTIAVILGNAARWSMASWALIVMSSTYFIASKQKGF